MLNYIDEKIVCEDIVLEVFPGATLIQKNIRLGNVTETSSTIHMFPEGCPGHNILLVADTISDDYWSRAVDSTFVQIAMSRNKVICTLEDLHNICS